MLLFGGVLMNSFALLLGWSSRKRGFLVVDFDGFSHGGLSDDLLNWTFPGYLLLSERL